MPVTFDNFVLKEASKISNTYGVLANERVLITGRRKIKANAELGFGAVFQFMDTWAEVTAILTKVGSPYTLTVDGTSYTNCYIYGDIKITESDSPGTYFCEVGFKQDTS